jgi:hypothetical protein
MGKAVEQACQAPTSTAPRQSQNHPRSLISADPTFSSIVFSVVRLCDTSYVCSCSFIRVQEYSKSICAMRLHLPNLSIARVGFLAWEPVSWALDALSRP